MFSFGFYSSQDYVKIMIYINFVEGGGHETRKNPLHLDFSPTFLTLRDMCFSAFTLIYQTIIIES